MVRSDIVNLSFSKEFEHFLNALCFIFTGTVNFPTDKMALSVKFASADGTLDFASRWSGKNAVAK